MTNAIAMRRVSAGEDGVAPIRDVDLEVRPGEVVALLGANGAGKSTTVLSIAGLATIRSGTVEVLGRDVTAATRRTRARLGLATVPDDRGVFAQLTVAENLRVGARSGPPAPELEVWFPELGPLLQRRAGLLSGGEQTVLALARALGARPGALVVDELSTGLAPATAQGAFTVLKRAAEAWGTGVLVAEQGTELALGIADRACVLRRGQAVFDGPASELRAQAGLLESAYLGESS